MRKMTPFPPDLGWRQLLRPIDRDKVSHTRYDLVGQLADLLDRMEQRIRELEGRVAELEEGKDARRKAPARARRADAQ